MFYVTQEDTDAPRQGLSWLKEQTAKLKNCNSGELHIGNDKNKTRRKQILAMRSLLAQITIKKHPVPFQNKLIRI